MWSRLPSARAVTEIRKEIMNKRIQAWNKEVHLWTSPQTSVPRPWLLSPSDLTGYNYLHICNGLQHPPHTLPAIQRVLYGPADFLLFPIRASARIEIHTHTHAPSITQHIPIHAHANTFRTHEPACSWYLCACAGTIIHRNNALPYAEQCIYGRINIPDFPGLLHTPTHT